MTLPSHPHLPSRAALMLPRVTLMFIQCRKVRSLAKKAFASVRRRVVAIGGWVGEGKSQGRPEGEVLLPRESEGRNAKACWGLCCADGRRARDASGTCRAGSGGVGVWAQATAVRVWCGWARRVRARSEE